MAHGRLVAGLLDVFGTASAAFARARAQHGGGGPYYVLDAGFAGRSADGAWLGGPVDSFKAWLSATLFAALAQARGDGELRAAAESVLSSFDGQLAYAPAGEGTAGYLPGAAPGGRVPLRPSGDVRTQRMVAEYAACSR